MPYVITTKRPNQDNVPVWERFDLSRRAVATLDEARQAAYHEVYSRTAPEQSFGDCLNAAQMLPDAGGTVGPLPDGTVIEVERKTWDDLARAVNLRPDEPEISPGETVAEHIIAAYNAAQAVG